MRPIESIKVLIIYSEPIGRAGLVSALGRYADFEVLNDHAEWERRPAPPEFRHIHAADVLVADYTNGILLAQEAAERPPGTGPKIIIVGGRDREREIRTALERGVRGYLLVGCALEELAACVRAVHRGARHLSPGTASKLAESLAAEPLTAREEEVLSLVTEGLCNKAISRRLGIAVGTVKSHLKSTFDKLGVESRTQSVVAVQRRGLLADRSRSVETV